MKFIYENTTIDPITQCWNWNKSVTGEGYGQFKKDKKYWTTHRYVFTQINGDIPNGKVIRHICHNRRCCNPNHLKLGSYKDNWHDSKDVHLIATGKLAKGYIINGIKYRTIREAVKCTTISSAAIRKYTDKNTRIFDVEAYRAGCIKAHNIPKI